MALTLSEYLLRDFAVERVDAALIESGEAGSVRFPASSRTYFHLVLSGSACVQLDEGGQPAELNAGDFALLLYGAPHQLCSKSMRRGRVAHTCDQWTVGEEPAVIRIGKPDGSLVLSGSLLLTRMLRSAPVNRALPHLLFYRAHPVSQPPLFADMTALAAACRGPGAAAFINALAQMYFIQALREVDRDMRQILPMRLGAPETGRMTAAIRKMRAHPERAWTVASLAAEVGCSRSSFAAKFHAYAGLGPIKFLSVTRLTNAANMLKANPDVPLWEVAKRVGYDTPGSFTRAFKAQFGVSPRDFTRQLNARGSDMPLSVVLPGAEADVASIAKRPA